ncbi:MAG: lysozyme, partial [Proteobacteria bacterium]|nr:lysozyme [Pseudomonadota bacterium]
DAADALLIQTVQNIADKVAQMVTVPLTDGQTAALLSFAYNLGTGALRESTLLRMLNQGKPIEEVAAQFGRWIHVGSKVLPGLVTRRAKERDVFLGLITP